MSDDPIIVRDPGEPAPGDPTIAEIIDDDVPGQHQFGPVVERFDEMADAALEKIRGHRVPDRIFTTASHVGDFSLIWHTINIALGIANRRPRRVIAFAAMIGLESLIVNQGVKRLFRRTRPTTTGDTRLRVRKPLTSSVPSGHASAATFASTLLSPRVGRPAASLVYVAASVVATSRAYVRIHHASDVIAGVVTGGLLAAIAKHVTKRLMQRSGTPHPNWFRR